MSSRFLNVAVRNLSARCLPYNVHRLNPANLFYPTGSPQLKGLADSARIKRARLPPAPLNFDWPCLRHGESGSIDVMAFGRNGDKILAVDHDGRTYLYEFARRTFRTLMPVMPKSILRPVTVAVGHDLYVMGRNGGSRYFFLALIDGGSAGSMTDWSWKCLQLPSFACSDDYRRWLDEDEGEGVQDPFQIAAYTVVGDSEIWISTVGAGTYSFDTKSGSWNKAWEWALPFRGGAEYVPEHNLWFGISDKDQQLCAFDLTAVSELRPPVPQNLGKDLAPPKDWTLRAIKLLPLGAGKLCIAKFFRTTKALVIGGYKHDMPEYFVVLTGVEVVHDCDGKALQMILHKSNRYNFGYNLADPL